MLPASFLPFFSFERKGAFSDCQYRFRNEGTTIYFSKVSSQCSPQKKKKKKRLCYLSICMFNSVLEVMGNPFINLVLQHLTLCFEVGLSSPGTKINLSQKEHPKGSVKFTGNAEN